MPAPRTVDPNGDTTATRFMNVRLSQRHVNQLEELAAQTGTTRSRIVRDLIDKAWTERVVEI